MGAVGLAIPRHDRGNEISGRERKHHYSDQPNKHR